MITIKNTQRTIKIPVNQVKNTVTQVLKKLEYQNFDIGIWFTTNKTIRRYNQKYRMINKPTDILSFPYHTNIIAGKTIIARTPDDKNLGDLIISAEYIARAARSFNIPLAAHLNVILVHGICHLIGYDHENTRDYHKMARVEKSLLCYLKKPVN